MREILKPHLVEDIEDFWKWWSVKLQVAAAVMFSLAAALPEYALEVWGLLPSELRSALGDNATEALAASVFALSILSRIVKQGQLDKYKKAEEPK